MPPGSAIHLAPAECSDAPHTELQKQPARRQKRLRQRNYLLAQCWLQSTGQTGRMMIPINSGKKTMQQMV
jgi:hypothetical protein